MGATALILAAVSARAQLATSPWPMFHHDPAHTALSQYDTSTNPGSQKWTFSNGGAIGNPAIGADGTIYVGCGSNLCAVNPEGTLEWAFPVNLEVTDVPAIGADGTIYVGANTFIYAINPDGSQKWSNAISVSGYTSPAIGADGGIYVEDQDKLIAIDSQTGVGGGWILLNTTTSPAVGSDGTVYATSWCNVGEGGYSLVAFPPALSPLAWLWQTGLTDTCGNALSSAAIGSDGTIYIGSADGNLYAVNPDGSHKWEFANGGFANSSPSIGPGGIIYIGSSDENLYALTDGGQGIVSQKWSFATAGTVGDAAIGSDGTIYVGSADHNLYAVNPDGSQKWKFMTGGTVGIPAIGADGTVYAGSTDNNLYAIGACPCATYTPTPTATPTPVPEKLSVSPHSLKFEDKVRVGTTGKPKIVKITNAGKKKSGLAVTIEAESTSTPVFAVTSECPPTLEPGDSCKLSVTFSPSDTAPQRGSLTIFDNAIGAQQSVSLSGKGKSATQK
jgi:outer membrane protein assembly factor BamB